MCFVFPQWVASIDLNANEDANANITVKMTESFTEQASQVQVARYLNYTMINYT